MSDDEPQVTFEFTMPPPAPWPLNLIWPGDSWQSWPITAEPVPRPCCGDPQDCSAECGNAHPKP